MLTQAPGVRQSSNFDLKKTHVKLIGAERGPESAVMSIDDLEAIRTKRHGVPASKHRLETICGASCDTGAQ